MTKSECRIRLQRLLGDLYWCKDRGEARWKLDAMFQESVRLTNLLPSCEPDTNERGNLIYRNEDADSELGIRRGDSRYFYDFGPLQKWNQFDTCQDASYFGMWVDVPGRRTFTYCEGDRTLVVCPTLASFKEELDDAAKFYGSPPPAWIVITSDGKRIDVYDPRPTVE